MCVSDYYYYLIGLVLLLLLSSREVVHEEGLCRRGLNSGISSVGKTDNAHPTTVIATTTHILVCLLLLGVKVSWLLLVVVRRRRLLVCKLLSGSGDEGDVVVGVWGGVGRTTSVKYRRRAVNVLHVMLLGGTSKEARLLVSGWG